MKHNFKRLAAFLLVTALTFSLLPLPTLAAEEAAVEELPSGEEVILPAHPDLPTEAPLEDQELPSVSEAPIEEVILPDGNETLEIPILDTSESPDVQEDIPEIPTTPDDLPETEDQMTLAELTAEALEQAALFASAEDSFVIESGSVTLTTPGIYAVTGTSGEGEATTNTITISGPGDYTLALVNVHIDCSAIKDVAAVALNNGANVTITLAGASTLASGENRAGIEVPEDCSLTVNGNGALTVSGGAGQYNASAGIGGGANQTNGPITIQSGEITANGGPKSYNGAAGIGGGCAAMGQNITITGGTIIASGSPESYYGAAGIGGGARGDAQDITITGGTITATGSQDSFMGAAGIGGGYMGSARQLSFGGGSVNAKSSYGASGNGAGIGGGYGGSASYITVTGGTVTANDGHVNSKFDGSNGAGIGGGGAITDGEDKLGGDADHITISGGTVNAYGNSRGAGIGGGYQGNASDIQITGGQVCAYGGHTPASDSYLGGAGIGGGAYGWAERITIETGITNSRTLSAYNGYGSAGIGGGCHGYAKDITIRNSNIYANAAYSGSSSNAWSYGAGIGGGLYGAGLNILIEGSTVEARASNGAAIGSGYSLGRLYNSNYGYASSLNPDYFITAEGAAPHGSFSSGLKFAATVEIGNGSIITASSCSGAAIGSGANNVGVGNYAENITGRYGVDVYIHDSEIRKAGTNGSGAGIGTGGYAWYCDSNIAVENCPSITAQATGSWQSGASIGSGNSNWWSNMSLSVLDCGSVQLGGYHMSGGAGIGTGSSNHGGTANVTVSGCENISGYMYSGTLLGTGTSNGSGDTNYNSCHQDWRDATSFTMRVTGCDSIYLQGTEPYNTGSKTGIGSGPSNLYNAVDIEVSDCGPISIDPYYYQTVGIGVGHSNQSNRVSVVVRRCGAITMGESRRNLHNSVGIGIGASSCMASLDYPTDYTVLVQDCASISMKASDRYFTGIGSGYNTRSCTGTVTVQNCGNILINLESGYESVGIGLGPSTRWNSSNPAWVEPQVQVQIQGCEDVSVIMNGTRNTGIGMGYYSYYSRGQVALRNCGDIFVFQGYHPEFNSGRNSTSESVGIGLGRDCYNCELGISISNCGDISSLYYTNDNGDPVYANNCTGIGSGYNCYSNGSSYALADGEHTYFPNTLDVQITDCGAVSANCGKQGVAIGAGTDNRDTALTIDILDCTSVAADGSYYGTGIGCGYNCYSDYDYIDGVRSTVNILRCPGGVTAIGGRYGSAIGSGGYLHNGGAVVEVNITDCGSVEASHKMLVDDSTIQEVNASQRGHGVAIGGGWYNTGGAKVVVNITNCAVDAQAEHSAAMGCGDRSNSNVVELNLENCTVDAQGGNGGGIGFGDTVTSGTVDLNLDNCQTTAASLTYGAGIGAGFDNSRAVTNVTINGGSVTATGAGGGSGIGTGPRNSVCRTNVTIDGEAVVVATGSGACDEHLAEEDDPTGSDAGAGIGGSAGQYVGTIIINSGDVTAVGGGIEGYCAAGIGGGSNAKAGTVTINGGTVHATAGHCGQCGAAGIGAGANSNAGTVTITGGDVTAIGAHGAKMGGAGIGGGPRGDGGTVSISGGTVNAIGSERGAGIGGGFNGQGGDVTISGGTITATGGLFDSAGIGGGANGEGGTLTLSGSPVLRAYGKSSNLAITSEITTSVPLFQGTMATLSDQASTIDLIEKAADGTATRRGVTLPANYDAFSLTLPSEGTYNAFLQGAKQYLLATTKDAVEDFSLNSGAPVAGERLTVIRFFDVAFDTGDGSAVPTQSIRMNKLVELPDDPTRDGFVFAGWFTDEECSVPYDFSMPVTEDMTLHAKWIEILGQPYVVYHYKANLEDGWDIGTITYGGEVPGQLVTAVPLEYEGFQEDVRNPARVASGYTSEGTTLVLKLYYQRTTIQVDVENAGDDYPAQFTAPYGTLMVLGKPTKEGYDFDRWTNADGDTIDASMPIRIEALGNVIFANWVLQEGRAAYQTKHYLRSLEGAYLLRVAEDYSGAVGDTVTVQPNDYLGFHVNHSISDETATGIIQADNSLALRVYYDRDLVTVKLLDTHNTAESVTAEYGAAANLPTPSWPGYTFEGWAREDGTLYKDGDKIESLGEAVTAKWSAGATTPYTVRYYKQDINGKTMEIASLEDLQGAAGSTVQASIRDYPGFTFDAKQSNISGVVDAEHPLILNVYYTRNTYTVSYVSNGGSAVAPQKGVYYTALADAPEDPKKTGYDFAGWYTDKALGDKHSFQVPVTHDLTLYAKWTPRADTRYTVKHYQQDVRGNGYTLVDTETLSGATAATATAQAKSYSGFHWAQGHDGTLASAAIAPDGSTELILYYDRNLHTVTFDSRGGTSVSKAANLRYGAAVPQPKTTVKEGYAFLCWCLDEEGTEKYDFTSAIAGDMILYALWQPNTYTVVFDYQGATGGNSTKNKVVTFDAAYGALPQPTRHGYTFDGWFTQTQGGEAVTADTTVKITAQQILYAHWTAQEDTVYKVEHYQQNVNGKGYTLADAEQFTGTTDTLVTAQAKAYHGFKEDTSNVQRVASGNLAGDGSLVLKLYYSRNLRTLTIDRANGQGVETESVYYGAARVMPSDPARRGYIFAGWTVDGVEVSSVKFVMPDNNVALTATWKAIDYSVTYRYTGSVPQGAPEVPQGGTHYNIGQEVTVEPVPAMEGYVLFGWTTKDVTVRNGKFRMPDGNVSFTGEWRKANYNVIYVYQGTVPDNAPKPPADTNAYQVGDPVPVLPAPTLEGYTFTGWLCDGLDIQDGAFKMPVGNVVLRGNWVPTLYDLTFQYSGDVPEAAPALPDTQALVMGEAVSVPPVEAVEGYTFLGWYVDSAPIQGGGFTMPARNTVVTGTWKKNTYPVTYAYTGAVPQGAPALPNQGSAHMGDSVSVAAAPTLWGYTFSGWATADAELTGATFTMPAKAVDLLGQWAADTYHIYYETNGGAVNGSPQTYTVESPRIVLPTPTRAQYTFDGWFTDASFTPESRLEAVAAGSVGDITIYAKWTAKAPPSSGGSSGGGSGGGGGRPSKPVEPLNKADHIAYIQGFPDGTVRPNANITRAEVAQIFFRLLTEEARKEHATTKNAFADVEAKAWYTEAVSTLAAMGIVKGKSENRFDPSATITRGEFAVIAARFDSDAYTGPNLFPDISGHWAAGEINRAAKKGWVKGDNNGLFRPDDLISRAEAVTLINRVLERKPKAGGMLKDMRVFPDNAETSAWYYLDIQEAANAHIYTVDKDGKETWRGLK